MEKLWTPYQEHTRRVRPNERKSDGGSYFDDELQEERVHARQLADEAKRLLEHLNQRPDHTVYVGSAEERTKLREVFNWWREAGVLMHNPNIRIEYGVPDEAIRVAE